MILSCMFRVDSEAPAAVVSGKDYRLTKGD